MTYRTAALSAAAPSRHSRKNRNTVSYLGVNTKLGPVSNFIVVFVLLALIGLLYLTQITKTSTYSYELDTLQNKYNEDLKENQALKEDAARLRSIKRVANSTSTASLVEADSSNTDYKN